MMLGFFACEDREVYSFLGQRYAHDIDCLEPRGVLEVVEGDPGPRCTGVRCYLRTDGEVFVSGACHSVPDYVDATDAEENTPCWLALRAFERGDAGKCPTRDEQ